ncbi:hypothetical protein [Dorea longicatena]|uniref:hypothetical protein n=1 Tax=Dorea longicatena TaxID=88431 RepID=UPI0032BF5AD0
MEIITGYTGKPHVTSEQDRDVNIGVVGEGSYVLRTGMQLAAEVSSNNEIKIRDGVLMHQGCTASIKKNTYDSLTITNGSQGMKRVDLIVARYEKNQDNGIESLDLKVIQGTPAESNPAAPQYTEGDIQAGDYVADMPMYQVIIEGLNITEVKKMFKVIGSNKNLSNKVAELNENITSVKSVNKNITKMIAGSKVVNAKASTSVQVFTNSEINKALGVTNSSNANTVVLMTNGDGLAQKVHVEGSTYLNSAWHATFNQDASAGSIRINYVIFYFGYGAVTVE